MGTSRCEAGGRGRCRQMILSALLAMVPSAALAGPCVQWRAPEKLGTLDTALISEASGIVASRAHPGRLYHNNDSGDGPYFYLTGAQGGGTQRVAVTGFVPRDVEDIALGPCAGAPICLYLGDIGDNARERATVQFVAIGELAQFPDEVAPLRVVEARYPDRAHDAESFAIHPNGDLYLITKEGSYQANTGGPAKIFRLAAAQLAAPAGEIQTFTQVGTIDLPALIPGGFRAQAATAMDISADGSRTLILTYLSLLEWQQDLSHTIPDELKPGRNYSLTRLPALTQAEAVAYLAEGDGVAYSTELRAPATEAPLHQQMCARREIAEGHPGERG